MKAKPWDSPIQVARGRRGEAGKRLITCLAYYFRHGLLQQPEAFVGRDCL